MKSLEILIIFFIILAIITIQYTLNKILCEIRKTNLYFEWFIEKGEKNEKKPPTFN